MRVPNADAAVIPRQKLAGYLLNVFHPNGRSKARLLLRLGYSPLRPEELEASLRDHLKNEVSAVEQTPFGPRYIVRGTIRGPSGAERAFRSIWQVDTGRTIPKLVTMVPERRL